jgi:hypothetical protein
VNSSHLKEITDRLNSNKDMSQSVRSDMLALVALANVVINDLGLSLNRPSVYFDAEDTEYGCAALGDILHPMELEHGQMCGVVHAYFSRTIVYRAVETPDGSKEFRMAMPSEIAEHEREQTRQTKEAVTAA